MPRRSAEPPPSGVIPGALSTEERYARRFSILVIVSMFLSPIGALALFGPAVGLFPLLGLPSVLFFASLVWGGSISVRNRRKVRRAGYRVCLHCRYLLADLPDSGSCAECGNAYTLEQLRRSWEWSYTQWP